MKTRKLRTEEVFGWDYENIFIGHEYLARLDIVWKEMEVIVAEHQDEGLEDCYKAVATEMTRKILIQKPSIHLNTNEHLQLQEILKDKVFYTVESIYREATETF